MSYKINWQTQGLQIHYGFLYSATVDVKMDTSQEQENVPLPIRFCFYLLHISLYKLLLAIVLVLFVTHEIFQCIVRVLWLIRKFFSRQKRREEETLIRIESLAQTQCRTLFAQGQQIPRLKQYLTL